MGKTLNDWSPVKVLVKLVNKLVSCNITPITNQLFNETRKQHGAMYRNEEPIIKYSRA